MHRSRALDTKSNFLERWKHEIHASIRHAGTMLPTNQSRTHKQDMREARATNIARQTPTYSRYVESVSPAKQIHTRTHITYVLETVAATVSLPVTDTYNAARPVVDSGSNVTPVMRNTLPGFNTESRKKQGMTRFIIQGKHAKQQTDRVNYLTFDHTHTTTRAKGSVCH